MHRAEPASIEAEQQLLGAALLNPDIIPLIARRGGASLFFDPVHQRIFEVAERKAKANELVSPVTMHVAMMGDEGLASLGSGTYLVRLAGASISSHAADDYVAMLADLRQKRQIVVAMAAAHHAITQGEDKADQIAARLEAALILVADADGRVAPVSMLKATTLALEQAHDAYHGRTGDCIASGIGALDEILGGFYPGELIILGGRPSMGKTGIALSIALNAARAGHGVVIASLEMNPEAMAMRALSEATAQSGHAVSYASLRRGTFTQSQAERLRQVTESVAMLPITFLPRQYSDIGALFAGARQVQRAMGGAMRLLIEHTAQQSIRDASGWGGGNGVNPAVGNATKRWQAAADHASTLRANLAELREREQSLTVQIDAPALAATLRDGIRMAEDRHAALGLDAEAHTARASEMRARLVEIERQIEVLTAEAAETAAATGKIVSPPALAQLHAEAAIARAAEGSAIRKAAQSEADRATLAVELDDMRQNLRFAIRAATAVEAEAALDPIKLVLARAAVANAETTFTVRFDTEQLVNARGSVPGE